jgi:iron complex transport system ATP-binding protein
MNTNRAEILAFDSLKIGYVSRGKEKLLLPPLNAGAFKGELIAVIGKNGIGKSTLLRTLTGLQPSLGGEILYCGKNIFEYTRMELAQIVGYISTEIVKVSNMSVYDLVALGRFPHTNWIGKIGMKNHKVIMDSLEMTSMLPLCNRLISELSDGERQRAMIARILAQDTGIMIMDEPTAFLDVRSKYEILHLMHHLSQKSGKTVIFSTHDLQMAIRQSDKIWLIMDDKLLEGSPEDLIIQGSFNDLFDSSSVYFNLEDGTFSFRSDNKGSIYLDGEGLRRYWTEKAIKRAGFSVSDVKTIPSISLSSENNWRWQLVFNDHTLEVSSIYELIKLLRNIEIKPIL